MTIHLRPRAALNIQPQVICLEEGPLAPIYDDLLKIILSSRSLHLPPLVLRRDTKDVRSIIHAIMVVSKRWNATMRELIVPLLNDRTIQWSFLPALSNPKTMTAPENPLYKFLAQTNRGSRLAHLDLSNIGRINADRLGDIVTSCVNVQSLLLSQCFFDLKHLIQLPKLKFFTFSYSQPLNVSALGTLPALESLNIQNCFGDPCWTQLNLSTSLRRIHIHAGLANYIKQLPVSLTSLTLFKTILTDKNPFQGLTNLKHLSFSLGEDEEFPSLENLSALESLEIAACDDLPEDYLNDVPQIKRLKVSCSENLPSLLSLTNLTKVILNSVDYPEISHLSQLTELKMVDCTYDWRTFAGMNNLKKLTLNNWNQLPVGISLTETPNLEMLHIRSNKLKTITARALTSLQSLKINCKVLQELIIPVHLPGTAQIDISKKTRRSYTDELPKGTYSKVLLF
jgi:hypothetical protein